jgi:cation-transporting ATPase 13A3/4/5
MAESLPTSVSAFTHRRIRADSTASFAFYDDDQEPDESPIIEDTDEETGLAGGIDDMRFGEETADEDDSTDLERQAPDNDYVLHRRASTQSRGSRGSVRSRLLRRDSGLSGGSEFGRGRFSQKTYMANEDLYIVIAGFQTSAVGLTIYVLACILTFGLAWLLLRWLPRWHVKLVGRPSTVRDCEWVVIEVRICSNGSIYAWRLHLSELLERNGHTGCQV